MPSHKRSWPHHDEIVPSAGDAIAFPQRLDEVLCQEVELAGPPAACLLDFLGFRGKEMPEWDSGQPQHCVRNMSMPSQSRFTFGDVR